MPAASAPCSRATTFAPTRPPQIFNCSIAAASRVGSAAAFAILAAGLLWKGRWIKRGFSREHVAYALRYGVPLIPHTLGMWAMSLADRAFITHYVGLHETGVYTVGVQIAMMIALVTTAFSAAWTPWLFERLKSGTPDDFRKVVQISWAYAAGLVALGVLVALLAPAVLGFLVGDQFAAAGVFVAWLAAGRVFHGLYQLVSGYLFYTEHTGTLTKITLLAAAVNVGLNFVFVPRFGAIGAAQAAMCAYAVYFLVAFGVANRIHPMPWNPFRTRS